MRSADDDEHRRKSPDKKQKKQKNRNDTTATSSSSSNTKRSLKAEKDNKSSGSGRTWSLLATSIFMPMIIYWFILAPRLALYNVQPYRLPDRPALVGALAVNDMLKKTEKLMNGRISGPESLLLIDDSIYTGTYDGQVVRVKNNNIVASIKWGFTSPCGNYDHEPMCGRPLGLRLLNKGTIVVVDAYLGIYLVDVELLEFRRLVAGGLMIDGRPLHFLNDVEIINDDLIYFTDSSTTWDRRRFLHISLEANADGRLMSVVPSTGEVRVVLTGLYFPNGVQLHPDRHSVIIAETTMARLIRYYIDGPKAGKTAIFRDNLPGYPDNIRLSSNGTLWVPLAGVRSSESFSALDFLGDKTWLRQMILAIIPESYLASLFQTVKPKHAMLVQLDANGEYVSSLHDVGGTTIDDISQVVDDGKFMYFGSYHSDFIGKLSMR